MSRQETKAEYSVLVFDMAHTGEPDGEHLVRGFRDLETAQAYAQARVRASVEDLRKPGVTATELSRLWHIYGEDCVVIDGGYRGTEWLRLYIDEPATPDEIDWSTMEPKSRRFYAALLFSDANQNATWLMLFFQSTWRPNPNDLLETYGAEARKKLRDKGIDIAEPLTIHIASLFELPEPPRPPQRAEEPLKNWRVTVDLVCHDIKFGATASSVFAWPEAPQGATLDQMARVVVADTLAARGDGPDYLDYTEILAIKVEESSGPPIV